MDIRKATEYDYAGLCDLFYNNQMSVPLWEEIKEYGIVAVEGDVVVGYVWAITGNCNTAFIDHLVVNKEYRVERNDGMGRAKLAVDICAKLIADLISIGVTKLTTTVMDNIYGPALAKTYKSIGFEFVNCLGLASGDSVDILKAMGDRTNGR